MNGLPALGPPGTGPPEFDLRPMNETPSLPNDIADVVARALDEDLGAGDITAQLIDESAVAVAEVRVREPAVLCGTAWFDEVFRQLDRGIETRWHYRDGQTPPADSSVCTLRGSARHILSGERTALNLLQALSGTATAAHRFVSAVAGTPARVLDTRKTLPGLRRAQKYAVRCGGAWNHRLGLFDAVLIKENHIAACGGIEQAVRLARARQPNVPIEVEVEDLDQVARALNTEANRLLLDNFPLENLRRAAAMRDARPGDKAELEASGGVDLESIRAIAETGVDFISVGAMTKHLRAIDFSMRFV
jgi:nicotinate-nucleotide pyrophosphorylase (carboxylating)